MSCHWPREHQPQAGLEPSARAQADGRRVMAQFSLKLRTGTRGLRLDLVGRRPTPSRTPRCGPLPLRQWQGQCKQERQTRPHKAAARKPAAGSPGGLVCRRGGPAPFMSHKLGARAKARCLLESGVITHSMQRRRASARAPAAARPVGTARCVQLPSFWHISMNSSSSKFQHTSSVKREGI